MTRKASKYYFRNTTDVLWLYENWTSPCTFSEKPLDNCLWIFFISLISHIFTAFGVLYKGLSRSILLSLKRAGSFTRKCSKQFPKFHRKEPRMEYFISKFAAYNVSEKTLLGRFFYDFGEYFQNSYSPGHFLNDSLAFT